jgi:uncharacterized membrane protein
VLQNLRIWVSEQNAARLIFNPLIKRSLITSGPIIKVGEFSILFEMPVIRFHSFRESQDHPALNYNCPLVGCYDQLFADISTIRFIPRATMLSFGKGMIMNEFVHRYGPKVAWPLVAFCIFILIAFAVLRAAQTYGIGPTPDRLFELRYLDHPIIAAIHMASGVAFILFAPLQFSKSFRSKHLGLHRGLGRVLVICALIAGIYGLIATVTLTAFGGVSSETSAWFFWVLVLFALLRAFWCVRNKNIALHRE